MALTLWFDALTADAHREVGDKAAQLGELSRAGLPVPPGYVVTAAALRAFFEHDQRLSLALAKICAAEENEEFDHLADVLVGLVRTREIPDRVARAICDAARALGEEPLLAVRASPDGDSVDPHVLSMTAAVLDVNSDEALLDAVKTCWASLFSPRVLHRQRRAGLLECAELRGGVIVQRMLDADKSGLAFSVEPKSGNPDLIEVDSTFGESEPLLTGAIEPDRYLVDKESLQLMRRDIGDKRVELVHDTDHACGRLRLAGADRARTASLDDGEVREIAGLVRKTEEYFHEPRGLEFVISGSELFAIDTRPVHEYRSRNAEGNT